MPHNISEKRLLALQEASRLRRMSGPPKKINTRLNPLCFLPVKDFFEAVIETRDIIAPKPVLKLLFINYDELKKRKIIVPMKREYIKKEIEQQPAAQFKRPPAVYSNRSPYGIASDYLFGK
jgi:hypothetical protein